MLLGRYILIASVFILKLYENIIESDGETLKGSTAPMVDMSKYGFKDLNTGEITP